MDPNTLRHLIKSVTVTIHVEVRPQDTPAVYPQHRAHVTQEQRKLPPPPIGF